MNHVLRQSREPLQRIQSIQISGHGKDTEGAQRIEARIGPGKRIDTPTAANGPRYAQPYVAAADNQ